MLRKQPDSLMPADFNELNQIELEWLCKHMSNLLSCGIWQLVIEALRSMWLLAMPDYVAVRLLLLG